VERSRVEKLPGYDAGGFIVQDAAQALLLKYAKIPEDAIVWDACAAPGGKTAVMSRRSRVLASELKRDRLLRLRETLARTAPGVPVFVADACHPPLAPMTVDVTVIDAPCSATGTMGRHPDGRWRITERSIARMAIRQGALLDGACTTVRMGGLIVYLTCSLEPEEDGEQVDLFLERHRSFERDRDDLLVFPPDSGTDGGFGACMRRVR
jgi:16S rRNA (cytosine967-C5)-methyltransferase